MASIALQKLLGATRDASSPQAQALDARIRTAISQIVSAQQDDGGWSWTGHGSGSHRYTASRAVWALALAKRAGYKIADERLEKARDVLAEPDRQHGRDRFREQGDPAARRFRCWVMATLRSPTGCSEIGRRSVLRRWPISRWHLRRWTARRPAKEILDDLGQRNLIEVPMRRGSLVGCSPWSDASVELRALFALGLEAASPESAKTKEQIDWLMANRTGHRWAPEKATGPAALAVAKWFAKTRFEGEHYKLTVFVNDLQAAVLDIHRTTPTRKTVDIPAHLLKDGKQRINFQLTGRGRYTYQVVLGGFVAADKLKNTTKNWFVRRFHEPAPLEFDGQEIPRGFDVLQGSYQHIPQPAHAASRRQARARRAANLATNLPANTPEEQLEYLVVTEPLPSGVTVVESSITGGFERLRARRRRRSRSTSAAACTCGRFALTSTAICPASTRRRRR